MPTESIQAYNSPAAVLLPHALLWIVICFYTQAQKQRVAKAYMDQIPATKLLDKWFSTEDVSEHNTVFQGFMVSVVQRPFVIENGVAQGLPCEGRDS